MSWTVKVSGLTNISGPDEPHQNETVVYTASGTFRNGGPDEVKATSGNTKTKPVTVLVECDACMHVPECTGWYNPDGNGTPCKRAFP